MKSEKTLKISPKIFAIFAGLVLVWALWFYRAEHQVARCHRSLINAVESRNWAKLHAITSDDFMAGLYSKEESIAAGQEALRPFLSIQLAESEDVWLRERPQVYVRHALIRMEGKGGGYADMVISAVNAQTEPFVFTWQRMSRKPWDWKLTRVEHPLLSTHYASPL
jgi:hypothetical protein